MTRKNCVSQLETATCKEAIRVPNNTIRGLLRGAYAWPRRCENLLECSSLSVGNFFTEHNHTEKMHHAVEHWFQSALTSLQVSSLSFLLASTSQGVGSTLLGAADLASPNLQTATDEAPVSGIRLPDLHTFHQSLSRPDTIRNLGFRPRLFTLLSWSLPPCPGLCHPGLCHPACTGWKHRHQTRIPFHAWQVSLVGALNAAGIHHGPEEVPRGAGEACRLHGARAGDHRPDLAATAAAVPPLPAGRPPAAWLLPGPAATPAAALRGVRLQL